MSALFHNLSWQALTNDNDSIILEFEAIGDLARDINTQLHNEIYRERLEQIQRGKEITEMLSQNFKDQTKTQQQKVEENLVDDILNNDETDYRLNFQIPVLKTEDEIDTIRIQENADFLEGELAKNATDFEIAAEVG